MSIFSIVRSCKDEDYTTEILIYALKKSELLLGKFLELTGAVGESITNKDKNIRTQETGSKSESRPDICVKTDQNTTIFVENKPWEDSKFQPNQIQRYVEKLLREHDKANKRILCLLTIQSKRSEQLKEIAESEGLLISDEWEKQLDIIRGYYKGKDSGVTFLVLTWRDLLDSLKPLVDHDDPDVIYRVILDALADDVKDPVNYNKILRKDEQFKTELGNWIKMAEEADKILGANMTLPFTDAGDDMLPSVTKESNPCSVPRSFWLKFAVLPKLGTFHWGPSKWASLRIAKEKDEVFSHPFVFAIGPQLIKVSSPENQIIEKKITPVFRFNDVRAVDYLKTKGYSVLVDDDKKYIAKMLELPSDDITGDDVAEAVIKQVNAYIRDCEEFVTIDSENDA